MQVTVHLLEHILHRDVDLIHYPVVDIADHILNDLELLEQFLASVEDVVTEDVLFAVDPKVREAFLSAVQYLGQITQGAFLVQHFVGLRELVAVFAGGADGLELVA